MDIKEQIKSLHKLGHSRKIIQNKLGCSSHTVSAALSTIDTITDLGRRIIKLRQQGMTLNEIMTITGCSKSTASKWSIHCPNNDNIISSNRKRGLPVIKSPKPSRLKVIKKSKDLRDNRKQFFIQSAGFKCQICNYNKCYNAFEFHHIDETTKRFNVSGNNLTSYSIETLIDEVEKCALLCANCHREQHEHKTKLYPIRIDRTKIDQSLKRITYELTEESMSEQLKWIQSKKQHRLLKEQVIKEIDLNKVIINEGTRNQFIELCDNYHYLGHSKKNGTIYNFIENDIIIGGVLLSNPVRKSSYSNVVEISRFVLTVRCQNLASKCLSLLICKLKQDGKYTYLQAFSQNDIHSGTIYKAANFRINGSTSQTYNYDGIHKKTIYERAIMFGMTEHEYAELFNLNKIVESPKTKFIYRL